MKYLVRTSVICFLCVLPLFSQDVSHPVQDDLGVYYGALHLVRVVHDQSRSVSDPKEQATIEKALRMELNLTEQDYAIVLAEAMSLPNDQHTGSASGQGTSATFSSSATRPASSSSERRIAMASKTEIAYSSITRLQSRLSTNGWTSFRGFVNGPFRQSVMIVRSSKSSVSGGNGHD